MPRITAEARGAAAFRVGASLPPPPDALTADEKAVWTDIIQSKPLGWFDAGSLQLLEQYCGIVIESKSVMAALRVLPADAKDRRGLRKELIHLNLCSATLATKLRLSVQSAVDRRSKMLEETGGGKEDGNLLGGKAVWRGGVKLRAVS